MTAGKKCSAPEVPKLIISPNIGKYATKNGPARTTRHLSGPETMVRSVSGKSTKFKKTANNLFGQICQF